MYLLSCFSYNQLCNLRDCSPPDSSVHGILQVRILERVVIPSSRQGHAATTAKSLQSCPTLCDPIDGSPPGSHPWDSPGESTGVGCHFLLQFMKVKSESEGAWLCLTLRDAMDCSLPGCSIHQISQARVLEYSIAFFYCKARLV